MKKEYKRYILEILFFVVLVAIDLVSKQIVFSLLDGEGSFVLIDKIFSLRTAKNTGASFSILSGQITFLTVLPTIAIIAIIAFLAIRPNTPKTLRIGAILIAAGALGNLVDRFALGYVRDFIDYVFLYTFFGIDFAIGNIADLFLCVGVVLLIVYIIFEYEDKDLYSKKKLEALAVKQNIEVQPVADCSTEVKDISKDGE